MVDMQQITVPSPLVSPEWLLELLSDESILDARLPDGTRAVALLCASMAGNNLDAEAIAGSIHADLEGDFSDPEDPLPHTQPADVQRVFERCGVGPDTAVICYDTQGVVTSARVWWLGRAAGLDNIAVLDGGTRHLPEHGVVSWVALRDLPAPGDDDVAGDLSSVTARPHLIVGDRAVEQALARNGVVVDARSQGRFAGVDSEPRPHLVSGHIPGSVNVPFTELFRGGKMKPQEEMAEIFRSAIEAENTTGPDAADWTQQPIIFSCGSGVTACVDALGATVAGCSNASVFDGSWSQWGDPAYGKPIA